MSPVPDKDDSSRASAPISLRRVRQLFSMPSRCERSQFLRREISGRMFERLSLIKTHPSRLLDAGCGEGDDLMSLKQAFPQAELFGVDASIAMLAMSRHRSQQAESRMKKLLRRWRAGSGVAEVTHQACADFGRLPLAASSMDMLWSNLALHWHPQPHRVMREWARVLRADGLLMFSAFGPDTFAELRMAYAKAGLGPAVLPFVDLHDYGDMMIEAGFADPVMDMEKLNITYSSSDELLADVRAFGGNPLVERKPGLTGRAAFAALKRGLDEQKAADGRISLSVEVVYGHAFRSLPKKNLAGESIVHLHRR